MRTINKLFVPRTTEHIYLNNQDITEICIGYNESNGAALVYIFLPLGRRLKTTGGTDYQCWVYGKLRIEKPDEL